MSASIYITNLFFQSIPESSTPEKPRFLSFQIATLDWITSRNEVPNVINCHDHHSGLIPFMMLYCHKYEKLRNVEKRSEVA